jgi:hypothetical protein
MLIRARTTIAGLTAAAMLATTSVAAVPVAQAASPGVYGEAPLVLASHKDDRRWKEHRRYRDRDDDLPAAIFGFAAGAILGSMLSQPRHHHYGDADDYCAAKFETYKPWTGTYRGYDGYEHPCP